MNTICNFTAYLLIVVLAALVAVAIVMYSDYQSMSTFHQAICDMGYDDTSTCAVGAMVNKITR